MEGEAQDWKDAYWGLYSDVVVGHNLAATALQTRINPDDALDAIRRLFSAALSRAERDVLALIDNE